MQSKEWAEELKRELDRENYPQWPNETMLKVLFGSYLKKKFILPENANVLDVGCFFGNNLFPFAAKGANCFGVDIHENIAKKAEIIFKNNGYDGNFTKGKNTSISHQDNTFDLLISVNTIHYEPSRESISDAIQEFKRVLKPGGRFYFSTLDEYKLWSTFHPKIGKNEHEYIMKRMLKMFQQDSLPDLIACYENYLSTNELGKVYSAILTDICFGIPTHKILKKKAGKSYGYLFSTQSEILGGSLGCFHASELPYVFGVHSKRPYSNWGPKESDEISENFQKPWTQFSKKGDPSFGDFTWNTYNNSLELALIGNNIRSIRNPFLERYEIIEKYKIF